jgi:acetyltransferase-like isoleucine patch superfamily enzyme
MALQISVNAFLSDSVKVEGEFQLGHNSVVGDFGASGRPALIGSDARIGRYCIVEGGVTIGSHLDMDDYCAIYSGSNIGNNVKLLYGKKIYGRSLIGDNCIIGGNVPERCKLADNVTFMGEVAHSHYDPTRDWDNTDEPSPIIGYGSIIGVNALIIGGISIGEDCYVSAGELLRHDLPDHSVYLKGQIYPISHFKGMLRTRAE